MTQETESPIAFQSFGAGRDADGASSQPSKSPWTQAAPRPEGRSVYAFCFRCGASWWYCQCGGRG